MVPQIRKEGQGHAYKFLSNYHLNNDNLEEAMFAAQKCLNYPEVNKAVLYSERYLLLFIAFGFDWSIHLFSLKRKASQC